MLSRRVPVGACRLELTAALLTVVLVALGSACGAADPTSASTSPVAAATAKLPEIGGWFGTGQGVKPAQVQFSVDMSENASEVGWFQYDPQQASAYAVINLNDCKPFCYNGHWHQRPVRLHFSDNKGGRLTIGEVFYLNGTTNLFGESFERWNFA